MEDEKRKLWVDAIVAYTGAANAVSVDRAIIWADAVVTAFEERFK